MGFVGDVDEGWFSLEIGLMFGWMLGCVILFYILGFSVWLICDRILLMVVGRFEEFKDVVIEFVIEDEDVVIGNMLFSELFLVELVIFIVIDEYDGDFLIIFVVLFEFFFDVLVGVLGNNCCLVGVGGLIILELEVIFVVLLEVFLIDIEVIGIVLECEFVVVICIVVSGVFLLVLDVVCVVVV